MYFVSDSNIMKKKIIKRRSSCVLVSMLHDSVRFIVFSAAYVNVTLTLNICIITEGICMHKICMQRCFNPLQTKRRPLYLKTQSIPRCKHFSSPLLKPISLCCKWHKLLLFSDKHKTHKYTVGRAYSC